MGVSSPQLNFQNILVVPTAAKLALQGAVNDGQLALVTGKSADFDGGQGIYIADKSGTLTAHADDIVSADDGYDGVCKWRRLFPGGPSPALVTLGTPVSGTITAVHDFSGGVNRTTFTLTAARIPVTDAAGSGSFGTLKLATLPEGAIIFLGGRQNYTAFAEGAALTGAVGDAVFDIGVGTVAIAAAADGALGGATDDNIIIEKAITLSGGTGTGTSVLGTPVAHDGTSTPATINLNWSGTAATIDASSTIDVTGTITVLWSWMGDD